MERAIHSDLHYDASGEVVRIEYKSLVPSWFICYTYDKKPAGLDNSFFLTPEVMLLEKNLKVDDNGYKAELKAVEKMEWQTSKLWKMAKDAKVVQTIDEDTIKTSVKKVFPLDKEKIQEDKRKLCDEFHKHNDCIAFHLQRETDLTNLYWNRNGAETVPPLRQKIDDAIYNETMHGIQIIPPLTRDLDKAMEYNRNFEKPFLRELRMTGRDGQDEYFEKLNDDPEYVDNSNAINDFYEKEGVTERFAWLIDVWKDTETRRDEISDARKGFIEDGLSVESVQKIVKEQIKEYDKRIFNSNVSVGLCCAAFTASTVIEALNRMNPGLANMIAESMRALSLYMADRQIKARNEVPGRYPFGFLECSVRKRLNDDRISRL